MWELDGALRVIRALQPATRQFGYHLALGGGVMNKGESRKDLDLYFLPMGGFGGDPLHRPDAMLKHLERLWGASEGLAASVPEDQQSFYKHAVKFTRWGGPSKNIPQRIDCFIF